MTTVTELTSPGAPDLGSLVELLRDSIENGASVGYLLPVDDADLRAYWQGVVREIADGQKHLLVSRQGGALVAAVQLAQCTRPNGAHRAEVQKLLVHSRCRRQGYGRELMAAVEQLARRIGRRLLVLDTEAGSPAQTLYERQGYQLLGVMPRYAASPAGVLKPCAFFYREL
jgi:GNAT superfamily N-acetyltransferase